MGNKSAREILAERLIELRESNNLTQQELADKLGITRQSLSLYERAERTINIDVLLEISRFFKVSTDYLLGISENKSTDEKLQSVCKYLRLTEGAVNSLQNIRVLADEALDMTLKTRGFSLLMQDVYWYYIDGIDLEIFCEENGSIIEIESSENKFKEYLQLKDKRDVNELHASNDLHEIINELKEEIKKTRAKERGEGNA